METQKGQPHKRTELFFYSGDEKGKQSKYHCQFLSRKKKEEPKVGIGIMYLVPASPADDRGGEVLRDTTHGISHLR